MKMEQGDTSQGLPHYVTAAAAVLVIIVKSSPGSEWDWTEQRTL